MSKRIYVGNLPWSVTKARLEELFSSFGEMEDALVVANRYTGRSRGFGFVTYKKDADSEKAIREMNGKDVEGRKLIVKEALPLREHKETGHRAGETGEEEGNEEMKEEKPAKKPRKSRKAKEE